MFPFLYSSLTVILAYHDGVGCIEGCVGLKRGRQNSSYGPGLIDKRWDESSNYQILLLPSHLKIYISD